MTTTVNRVSTKLDSGKAILGEKIVNILIVWRKYGLFVPGNAAFAQQL